LALKAFLALHGKTAKELRKKFGHDLNKLLKEATKRGLVLRQSARRNIELLEEATITTGRAIQRKTTKTTDPSFLLMRNSRKLPLNY
jgi:hypothetical protein